MIWKSFILILSTMLISSAACAESYLLDEKYSKITYILTQFKIPFKIKSLPTTGQIEIDKNNTGFLKHNPVNHLRELSLQTKFTSSSGFFRRVINFNKYPHLTFTSNIEKPIPLHDKKYVILSGYLNFHGVSKKVNIKLKCKSKKERILLTGILKIKMNDFGIKPPRILFFPVDNIIKTRVQLYTRCA